MDNSSTVREQFVSFSECSYGLNGQSLFKTIKEFIDSYCIDILDRFNVAAVASRGEQRIRNLKKQNLTKPVCTTKPLSD